MNTTNKNLIGDSHCLYLMRNIFIIVSVLLLGFLDCAAQPRGEGRYYERNSELLSASSVFESTMWGIGLLLVAFFISTRNSKNPYLGVIGIGSMLIGLMCFIPLFAYLFAALQFLIIIFIIITVVIFTWNAISKQQKLPNNATIQEIDEINKTEGNKIINHNINHNTGIIGKVQNKSYWDENERSSYHYDEEWRKVFYFSLSQKKGYSYYYNKRGRKIITKYHEHDSYTD